MPKKVYVSYKYADDDVQPLQSDSSTTTVRDYVGYFEERAASVGLLVHTGEYKNRYLPYQSENRIWERLKDKMGDSAVIIVFVSPQMKELFVPDKKQWIPWELSFSLREQTSNGITSHSKPLLVVVLPDKSGNFYYYNCMTRFRILQANIDNGYAEVVQWNTFVNNIEDYIKRAEHRKTSVPPYLVDKTV